MNAHRVEYHRNAMAVLPETCDKDPGVVIWARKGGHGDSITCNCRVAKSKKTCPHIRSISSLKKTIPEASTEENFDAAFRKSPWYRLAGALHDACLVSADTLTIQSDSAASTGGETFMIKTADGDRIMEYAANGRVRPEAGILESELLMQRCGLGLSKSKPFHRGRILSMLSLLSMTDAERVMAKMGSQSRRQALEASFWYKLAYHCHRMQGENDLVLRAEIDACEGRPAFIFDVGDQTLLKITVPKAAGYRVLSVIGADLKNQDAFRMVPESLQSIVEITAGEDNGLILKLKFLFRLPNGETEIVDRKKLKPYWNGDTVYLPDKGVFATVQKPDVLWDKFGGKYTRRIRKEKVPGILDQLGGNLFAPPNIIDESVNRMRVHTECRGVEIIPEAAERDWCWLLIHYGFGEGARVSLADIYRAKKSGERYIPVADGWVDVRSFDMDALTGIPGDRVLGQLLKDTDRLKLSRLDLFRLKSAMDRPIRIVGGDARAADFVSSVLMMQPPETLPALTGLSSILRQYQKRGVEWLMFLFENRFGGLLCDDMGLGKTHQVMALMVWFLEYRKKTAPFLVVCPTTVISHWERKIREYAPGLQPVVYHGTDRELDGINLPGKVVITSYGILLRDVHHLSDIRFSLAAFDEAQFIKNTRTKSFWAALLINADMKIGVTGTPVENRLTDLKGLMDLVLPGYLGSDDQFAYRYMTEGPPRISELSRLVAPFTLRRTKEAVLAELPDKIEDMMFCRLTEIQVRMYRDAVNSRGDQFRSALAGNDQKIPYIHIFALLTLLKQICNHPAIINPEKLKEYPESLDSGKWELFKDLVGSCLESGRKIVVYSQFVTMVDMIVNYLNEMNIDVACITGASRNRGRIIDRFNDDPKCRVFVGSLKAGGTGIDLTAASVVIHYDRWWNAAKEDQATDRVHRMGQTRGVQVFKLVTEGTLEEKISAIIAKKKRLMNDVVAEDNPGLLKAFSRDELMELIKFPEYRSPGKKHF